MLRRRFGGLWYLHELPERAKFDSRLVRRLIRLGYRQSKYVVVREERGSSAGLNRGGLDEGSDEDTQEFCEPSQEQAEVVACSGEDSVDTVAETSLEIIPVHAVLGLDVADDGLDSRATLHLATDGSRDAADLPRDPDPEPMRVIVAAIPFVDVDAASLHAGELLHVGDHGAKRVPVEGIAMQGLGVEHELSALRRRHGGGDTDLAAELVGRAGLTLADALDLRGM
jgi:hypothetical protein